MDTDTTQPRTTRPSAGRAGAELERLRHLAYLLDDAFRIPIVNYRFGIDSLIGLVPVIGDLAGFFVSAYLIYRARRLGAPSELQARMMAHSTLDLFIGSVPVVGDVLDFFIKPNRRSIRLLESYLESGMPATR